MPPGIYFRINNWKRCYCIDCHKELCKSACYDNVIRCRSCNAKYLHKTKAIDNRKDNAITKLYYYCRDCHIQILYQTALYGSGLCRLCAIKLISGKNHYLYGQHLPENIKHKLSLIHIGLHVGELNGMWQGGLNSEEYTLEWTEKLREYIRDRDHRECQLCRKLEKEFDEALSIHHIDYNKKNCSEDNLISLCNSCHLKTNGNRDYYYAYFTYIIRNLYEFNHS